MQTLKGYRLYVLVSVQGRKIEDEAGNALKHRECFLSRGISHEFFFAFIPELMTCEDENLRNAYTQNRHNIKEEGHKIASDRISRG